METCYKVFRREVIQSITLKEDRFGIEPEVTAKVGRAAAARLRGADQLLRAHLRRGEEDRLEGRRARHLRDREVRRLQALIWSAGAPVDCAGAGIRLRNGAASYRSD